MSMRFGQNAGVTIIELLVSLAVIGVMAAAVTVGVSAVKVQANKAACVGNLRTIHAGLASATQELGHWPQLPEGEGMTQEKFVEFWVTELGKHGVSPKAWICPGDKDSLGAFKAEGKVVSASYFPAYFDTKATSPYQYNTPWVVERGGFHGKNGGHIVMPDGSVTERANPFAGR